MTWKKMAVIAFPAIALALGVSSDARAQVLTNGNFNTTGGDSGQIGNSLISGTSTVGNGGTTTLAGWTMNSSGSFSIGNGVGGVGGALGANGYGFLYQSGAAANAGGQGVSGLVALAGPVVSSPAGGAFVALDPLFKQPSIIQTTVTGLTSGASYTVSFFFAGAQQTSPPGTSGATTEFFTVGFGGAPTQNTITLNTPSQGFSGWNSASLTFKADGTSDVLSFLAGGGPSTALPPFVLLDGVSVTSSLVPEPSTFVLAGTALLGFGAFKLRRRGKSTEA
jgi:hypothetical protein